MPSPDEIHADPDAVNLPDAAAQSPNTSPAAAERMPVQADTLNPRPTTNRSADSRDRARGVADDHDNNPDASIDTAGHGRFGRRPGDVVDAPDATDDATRTQPGDSANQPGEGAIDATDALDTATVSLDTDGDRDPAVMGASAGGTSSGRIERAGGERQATGALDEEDLLAEDGSSDPIPQNGDTD
ncbi:MAG TPA: hypothetical protein VGN72_22810 [Tepidisphaeraceae bacterium]|jgi:hypothetical protein|nr:hypothetical protein [Tepidisphaeraceae bacterium]